MRIPRDDYKTDRPQRLRTLTVARALQRLKENHREEFEGYLREERKRLGLGDLVESKRRLHQ